MCQVVKCKNPACSIQMQTCQMINGYCHACWQKVQQGTLKFAKKCLAFF